MLKSVVEKVSNVIPFPQVKPVVVMFVPQGKKRGLVIVSGACDTEELCQAIDETIYYPQSKILFKKLEVVEVKGK